MKKGLVAIKTISAFCVLALAFLLCFGCLSIVFQNNPTGQMYEAKAVKAHFGAFGLIYLTLFILLILTGIISCLLKKTPEKNKKRPEYTRKKPANPRRDNIVRIGLLVSSAVLIVLGIVNGGFRDIFVKAVNICTECIGLG